MIRFREDSDQFQTAYTAAVSRLSAMKWFRSGDAIETGAYFLARDPLLFDLEMTMWRYMPVCSHVPDMTPVLSDHSRMPRIRAIGHHWMGNRREAGRLFGWSATSHLMTKRGVSVGCFGCMYGRAEFRGEDWPDGCLERAHLQDAWLNGPNTVDNLIPLCSLCHWRMTRHFTGCRSCAIKWVRWLNKTDQPWKAEMDQRWDSV